MTKSKTALDTTLLADEFIERCVIAAEATDPRNYPLYHSAKMYLSQARRIREMEKQLENREAASKSAQKEVEISRAAYRKAQSEMQIRIRCLHYSQGLLQAGRTGERNVADVQQACYVATVGKRNAAKRHKLALRKLGAVMQREANLRTRLQFAMHLNHRLLRAISHDHHNLENAALDSNLENTEIYDSLQKISSILGGLLAQTEPKQ